MGDVPADRQSKPVSLREITAENLKSVLRLSVSEEQKRSIRAPMHIPLPKRITRAMMTPYGFRPSMLARNPWGFS